MCSFPNLVPLAASTVKRIVETVMPYQFGRIHAAWGGKTVTEGAKSAVENSAERYIKSLRLEHPEERSAVSSSGYIKREDAAACVRL